MGYCHIVTTGCKLNENDTEKMYGILKELGYEKIDDRYSADVILFNTCAIREGAEKKIFGSVGAIKAYKNANPNVIIGICGCMPEQEHITQSIIKKYPFVDLIFGARSVHLLPTYLGELLNKQKRVVFDNTNVTDSVVEDLPIVRNSETSANVTIMYGCNNFCSYCIVPYVRGRERSRRSIDIIDEVENLVKEGYKEIILLGQNVNSYGLDCGEISFAQLLREIDKIDGNFVIRFVSSHPKDVSDELIYTIRDCKKVSRQFHLPIQSGSDRILSLMNRQYTTDCYFKLVEKMRLLVPDITITSDIIIGFPSESDSNFNDTIEFVKKIRFSFLYIYLFSRRKGTKAYDMECNITDETKKKRFETLNNVQNEINLDYNKQLEGKIITVFVDGLSKRKSDVLTAKTDHGKTVHFRYNNDVISHFCKVKIVKANTFTLNGEFVNII